MESLATRETVDPPLFDLDPYSYSILEKPYAFHQTLRDMAPVVKLEKYGVYGVGRYDSVKTMLQHPSIFLSGGGVGLQDIRKPGKFRIPSKIAEVDPPDHTRVRSALTQILSPIKVRSFREKFEHEAQIIAEQILDQGTFDGVTEVAERFIFTVFPDVMGLDMPRNAALTIAEMRFNQTGPANALYEAAMEAAEPYMEWFDSSCKREAAHPGGFADEIFRAADSGHFEPEIAENLVRALVGGGVDTTIAGIGFTLMHLARNPRQWDVVKSDPKCVAGAFDEALRLEAPSAIVYRTTAHDTDLAGYRIRGDAKVAMFLIAANRDPRKWENPESFDVTRQSAGIHFALGNGLHVCMGQMLARLEAGAILGAIVKRARKLEMAGSESYRVMNQVHALRHLPLRVVPE